MVTVLSPATYRRLPAKSTPNEVVSQVLALAEAGVWISDETLAAITSEARPHQAAPKKRRRRGSHKASERTLRPHEAEERERQEAGQRRVRAARTTANEIINRFGRAHKASITIAIRPFTQ